MSIVPDGIRAAAEQEKRLHPTLPNGKTITAWGRRATTIENTITAANLHEQKIDTLTDELAKTNEALRALQARPF